MSLTGWYLGFSNQSNTRGTVKDKTDFKEEEDVSSLRKAIEGLGKFNESIHFIYVAHFHKHELSKVLRKVNYCKKKSPQSTI